MKRLKIISLLIILLLMISQGDYAPYSPKFANSSKYFYYENYIKGYDRLKPFDDYYPFIKNLTKTFANRINAYDQILSDPNEKKEIKVALLASPVFKQDLDLILTVIEMAFEEAIKILNPMNFHLSIRIIVLPHYDGPRLFVAKEGIENEKINMLIGHQDEFVMSYITQQSQFKYRIPVISPYTPSLEYDNKIEYNFLTRVDKSYSILEEFLLSFFTNFLKYKITNTVAIFLFCEKEIYLFQCKPIRNLQSKLQVGYDFTSSLEFAPTDKFQDVRIVILAFPPPILRQVMLLAQKKGFTDRKDYMFISLNFFDRRQDLERPWLNVSASDEENQRAKEAFRSVLIVTSDDHENIDFLKFSNKVTENAKKFYDNLDKSVIKTSVAAHYDSLMIYVNAVKKAMEQKLNISDGLVINDFLWNTTHKGAYSEFKINENGDRYTDLAILDMNKEDGIFHKVAYYSNELKRVIAEANKTIDWNTGEDNQPPLLEPKCGYNGLGCKDNNNMRIGIITGGVMLGLIIIAFIVMLFAFRRAKFSSELKAMAWQISPGELTKIHRMPDSTFPPIGPNEMHKQSVSFTTGKNFSKQKKKISTISSTSQCDIDYQPNQNFMRNSSGFAINSINSKSNPKSNNGFKNPTSSSSSISNSKKFFRYPESFSNQVSFNTSNDQNDPFPNITYIDRTDDEPSEKNVVTEPRIENRKKGISESFKRFAPSIISNRLFSSSSVSKDPSSKNDQDSPNRVDKYERGDTFNFSENPITDYSFSQLDRPPMSIKRKFSYENEMLLKSKTNETESGSNMEEKSPMIPESIPEYPRQSQQTPVYKNSKNKFRKTSTFMPGIFRPNNQGSIMNEANSNDTRNIMTDSTNSVNSIATNSGTKRFANTAIYKGNEVALKFICNSKRIYINRELQLEVKKIKEMNCDHLCRFIGACLDPSMQVLVTEYCARGSLHDVLDNSSIKLDPMFKMSMMQDICRGMLYLQSFNLPHKNLTSRNCLVDSRFVVKISDFGLQTFMQNRYIYNGEITEQLAEKALFIAPEILVVSGIKPYYEDGNFASDVYSFAIICQQILYRKGPFFCENHELTKKSELVNSILTEDLRPTMEVNNEERNEDIVNMIKSAWGRAADNRPTFSIIKQNLKKMNKAGDSGNLLDNILQRMEQHAGNLEVQVQKRTQQYLEEKQKAEKLLYAMLPESVASQLIANKPVTAESYDCVTIYFSDIVGFTSISAKSTPMEVIEMLNELYTMLDNLSSEYDVYKVETIGDAYMVVSGLPQRNGDTHVEEICSMALEFLSNILRFRIPHMQDEHMRLRIGVHSGPVCAGVVGRKMPRYCLFGDTVNTTSRMESTGSPLKIHISQESVDLLLRTNRYIITERGMVSMKGKGEKRTYWLHGQVSKDTNEISIIDDKFNNAPILGNMERYVRRYEGMKKLSSEDINEDDLSQFHSRIPSEDS